MIQPISLDLKLRYFIQERLSHVYGPAWRVVVAHDWIEHGAALGSVYMCVGKYISFFIPKRHGTLTWGSCVASSCGWYHGDSLARG